MEKHIYLVFTDTGTYLSRIINMYTRENLNHVSIALDENLDEVYSFGRKNPENPFIAGFVQENLTNDLFQRANCLVYKMTISLEQYQTLSNKLRELKRETNKYRYNLAGLMTLTLGIEWERKHSFFCSQFAAKVLSDSGIISLEKHHSLTRPGDLKRLPDLELVYEGMVSEYMGNLAVV